MSNYTLKFNRTNANSVIIDLCERARENFDWEIEKTVTLNISDVPEILINGEGEMSIAAYGLLKAVQDRNSALSEKALGEMGLTGRAAQEERVRAYEETFEFFKTGFWRSPSQASKGSAVDPILAAAIAEIKGVSIMAATQAIKALDADGKKALRSLPVVQETMAKLRDEAQGESGLLDDLLS